MKKVSTMLLGVLICLILVGCESEEKKAAKEAFNAEVERIESEEIKLDEEIKLTQDYIAKGLTPLDETKITELEEAIRSAKESKKDVPEMPEEESEIRAVTENKLKKIEYTTVLSSIQEKKTNLENSVKQFKQLTNPTSDFILERLKNVTLIIGMSAITEETDPYGDLNKAKSYTGMVFFASSLINQDEVYVDETMSKGDIYIDKGTAAGGAIEIYTTVEDAKKRDDYLGSFDGTVLSSGKHTVVGTVIVRTSHLLPASKQDELERSIVEVLIRLE